MVPVLDPTKSFWLENRLGNDGDIPNAELPDSVDFVVFPIDFLLIYSVRPEHQPQVIGAGLTGCSAALHFAKLGASCLVIEAREICGGATGRNGGHL